MTSWSLLQSPFSTLVPLGSVPLSAPVVAVKERYEAEFGTAPADQGGWYHPADWHRISFVLEALRPGGRFLDVGLGAGQFVNAVAGQGGFDEVHGADPFRFNKYIEFGGPIARVDAGIDNLPYPDDHFDVVTCMEVLEHVPAEVFAPGLAELRRVCRGQLVMSVPFEEPEPIYDGHQRRFTGGDIVETFPGRCRVLLYRSLTPWAVVEEWCGESSGSDPVSGLERAARHHGSPFGFTKRVRVGVRSTLVHAIRRVRRLVPRRR